jgi:hypothetical protein
VAYQTVTALEWVIFFDVATPKPYRSKIDLLRRRFPFHAEYTDLFDMDKVVPKIRAMRRNEEWLLTTRLDSDDVLAKDFVERLRGVLRMESNQVINFNNGAILSLSERSPKLYLAEDRSNPFASLLERFDDHAKTIWAERHVNIDRLGEVDQVFGRPAWMQVIHGENVSNRVKGKRVLLHSQSDIFPLLGQLDKGQMEKEGEIALENKVLGPIRSGRETARRFLRRTRDALLGR